MDLFNIWKHSYNIKNSKEISLSDHIFFLDDRFTAANFRDFLLEVLFIALIIALINSIIAFCVCKKKPNGFVVFITNVFTKFNTILLIRMIFQILPFNEYLDERCWFFEDEIQVQLTAVIGFLIIAILFILDMIMEGALYRKLFLKDEKDGLKISVICNIFANIVVILIPVLFYCIERMSYSRESISFYKKIYGEVYVYNYYFKEGLMMILIGMMLIAFLSLIFASTAKLFKMNKRDIFVIVFSSIIVNMSIMSCLMLLDGDINISKMFIIRYPNVGDRIYLFMMIASVIMCAVYTEKYMCKKIIKDNTQKIPKILIVSNLLSLVSIMVIQVISRLL